MSDEYDIYVGMARVPDMAYLGWQTSAETLFSESDFFDRPWRAAPKLIRDTISPLYDDHPTRLRYLAAPSAIVRRRLQIQGYTREFCARAWSVGRDRQIDTYEGIRDKGYSEAVTDSLDEMKALSLEGWLQLMRDAHAHEPRTFGGRHNPWNYRSLLEVPHDPFVQLILLDEAIGPATIWMDCSSLYGDEDVDILPPHQLAAAEAAEAAAYPSGKIIVLTEGRSDTRIISASLGTFYPEYADAYQFIDFEEFRIEGGASIVARMVKVLAGARVQNRLIALFDNDAAGVEAYKSLRDVKFPGSVRLMHLPDTALARSYPTLGPGGLQRMDVNGAGAPIELYLGRSALTGDDGKLRPIRWSQWNRNVERYHGVVQDKEAVASAFSRSLVDASPKSLRKKFPEMDLLLNNIFSAFEDQAPPVL
jgi:hypothetical protein